jgi:Putative auto-transporter adhesin, head GIN domain
MKILFRALLFLLYANALATDQVRPGKAFDAVKIDGPFKAIINADKISSITITGDEDIIPWINSEIKNRQLIISMKPGVKPHYSKRVVINIKAPTVDTIVGSNHASIEVKNLRANQLSIGLDKQKAPRSNKQQH